MPEPIQDHQQTEEETEAALNELGAHFRRIREHKQAAKAGLDEALMTITEAIRQHWTTGGGTRLRQIVWSLWNGNTLVNLYGVLGGLDYDLSRAVAKLLEAYMMGALETDDYLRRVLEDSGEFTRYDDAAAATPEGEDVIYPALPCSPESLRDLADAAESREVRFEAATRAEDERLAHHEEVEA